MQTFLPIILGSDENAYGTVRLFREAYGIRPLLVCTRRLIPTMDSDLFDLVQIENFDRDEVFRKELLRILAEYRPRYDRLLVVACSDYYAGMMSKYHDDFDPWIANRFLAPSLLEQLDTKDKFYALCEKHGLDYPKTVICEPDKRKEALEQIDFPFPIVVKPENSNAYDYLHCSFEGKEKVFYFATPEEYLTMVQRLDRTDYRGKLIIQEFIPGGDDAMRVINCYSDNRGKVRMMCLGQPVLEEYAPKMLGNYAAIVSRSDPAIYSRIRAFLEEIGYVGFSNFDMKYDTRTGRYLLFEINPRLGRSSFFVRAAGLNMMQALTEDVVFGKKASLITGEKEALWTAVPRTVLSRYVEDPALRAEVLRLWKTQGALRTLFCPEERSLRRKLRITRYYLSHIRTYKKYYFSKKDGAQQKK